jgi:hypothetical protein
LKLVLTGSPHNLVNRGNYVAFEMPQKPPGPLPKGLPPVPQQPINWLCLVNQKQWKRVEESLAAFPDTTMIIEGYPCLDGARHVVFAQQATTVAITKARQEAQRAAALAQEG